MKHYRLAHQLRRTIVTMDRDYLDDRRFPAGEGSGVFVIHALDERLLRSLLDRIDRMLFHPSDQGGDATEPIALPLDGRKMHIHTDWGREPGR